MQIVPLFAGTIATAMLFAGRGGGAYSYVIGGILGFSTLGMLFTSVGAGQPKKLGDDDRPPRLPAPPRRAAPPGPRDRPAAAGRAALSPSRPAHALVSVDSYRLWERRPDDSDFAVVRIAVGPQTLATPLIAPVTRPLEDLEPMTAGALRRFLDGYSIVPDLPVAVSLRSFSACVPARAGAPATPPVASLRAMIAQLATFHAPEELLVAFCSRARSARASGTGPSGCRTRCTRPRSTRVGPVRLAATTAPRARGPARRPAGRPVPVHPGAARGQRASARRDAARRGRARRRRPRPAAGIWPPTAASTG